MAVELSREKEAKGSGVGVICACSSECDEEEEERKKKREQFINRVPLNVSVYIPSCSPSSTSSITTVSRMGTINREMGVSSSLVNVHSLSDIQRDVN